MPAERHTRRTAVPAVSAAMAGLLLLGSGLAGCSSPTEDYCGALKDDKAKLQEIAADSDKPTMRSLKATLPVFDDLQENAPDDVKGDWKDFGFAWTQLVQALDTAGIDPATFDPGKRPAGVSEAEFEQIKEAAAGLRSDPVRLAAHRIEDHARTICHVDLGGGGLAGL